MPCTTWAIRLALRPMSNNHGLHDHECAVRLKGLFDMGRGANRIAHVVQGIEYRHKSIVATWVFFRRSDAEMDVRDLLFLGMAICCLDGSRGADQIHGIQI